MTGFAGPPLFGSEMKAFIILILSVSSALLVASTPVNAESLSCNGNGDLQTDGTCQCFTCWAGDGCDTPVNPHAPKFLTKTAFTTVYVGEEVSSNSIFTAEAVDADANNGCFRGSGMCGCGIVRYAFGSGNQHNIFNIDPETGKVRVNQDSAKMLQMWDEDHVDLEIIASNPDSSPDQQAAMTLRVNVERSPLGLDEREGVFLSGDKNINIEPLSRHRRAAITLPSNVTFKMNRTDSSPDNTEMRVGTKVSFELQILFPQSDTDMLVELFAPDNESIVMMLCDVRITKGANLVTTLPGEIVMDSQNSSNKFIDRVIIDFGNVSNSFTDQSSEEPSSIFIHWNAIMIQNDATTEQTYYVSAGAEFGYETYVWVGSACLEAKLTETETFNSSTFNLTGPDSMMVGTSAIFTLDIYMTQPSVGLSVDVFAPLNESNIMSICGMKVVETGDNYKCGFLVWEPEATFHMERNTEGYDRARLPLGTMTNQGARDPNNPHEANLIRIQFVVKITDDMNLVNKIYSLGAAVEIGSIQIWAGQILITVIDYVGSSGITPSWTVEKEGSGMISSVAPLSMVVDITLPQGTAGSYALEVLAPFNDSAAVFQVCALRVVSIGQNLGCVDTDLTPTYTARGDPSLVDRAYATLGKITNVGTWGYQPYNLSANENDTLTPPDVLRVQLYMKGTNHSLFTVGSTHPVTLGLLIDDTRLLVGYFSVEVEADAVLENITTEQHPSVNMTLVGDDTQNFPLGGVGQMEVTISTKPNVTYAPFDIEALMPNSSDVTRVSVCSVAVHRVGKNLPCVIPAGINSSVFYTSGAGDGYNDRAVANLKSLCNLPISNDTAEDDLVLKVGFQIMADSGYADQECFWLSAGLMFSPYKMLISQKSVCIDTSIVNAGAVPHVAAVLTNDQVPVGYFATYHLLIKPQPGEIAAYTVNITVTDPTVLSVCSVKVIQIGASLPCMNASLLEATYEKDPATGSHVKADLDLKTVASVGSGSVTVDSNVDDNTIVVEVILQLSADTAKVADASTHDFNADVNYGAGTANPASVPQFTALHDVTTANVTASNVSSVELSVVAITDAENAFDNSSEVMAGQMKLFHLCSWTYPASITRLSMKMLVPTGSVGKLEVTHIGVAYSGKNMPCANCNGGAVTYDAVSGSLDLGFVLNNNLDTVDPDANKLCVAGVFRVLKVDTVTVGSTVSMAASINVGDQEIAVLQSDLTVVDNASFTDIYPANMTVVNNTILAINTSAGGLPDPSSSTPLTMIPGSVQTFPLVLTVPPYTTAKVEMDLKLDVNESACMTYQDIRLIGVGRNLNGFGKATDMECTTNSSTGTSQMDVLECSFGVVTNPGMYHRCEDIQDGDDAISVEIDLQMADCPMAEKDAEVVASFGLKVPGFIAILNYSVTVDRVGSEQPVFNTTCLANSSATEAYISCTVRLDNTSTAETFNTSLIVTPPDYLVCDTLDAVSGTSQQPDVNNTLTALIIGLNNLFFTDVFELTMRCIPSPSYTVPPGIQGAYTVIIHQTFGEMLARVGSTHTDFDFHSPMDFANVSVTTVSDSGVSCTSAFVGLNDTTKLFDCQISGSKPEGNPVTNGRKSGSGWTPYLHKSQKLMGQRYFQVYFANKMLVDSLEVAQTGAAKVTKIQMAYSNDGRSFLDGDTIVLAGSAVETVTVPNPKDSQVVRVYIQDQNTEGEDVQIKFEFFGCETITGGPSTQTDICNAAAAAIPTQTTNSLFYHRSFLSPENTDIVYVCDGVVDPRGLTKRCFMSNDGRTWQELDPRLGSMVGHESETNRVYAMASDGVTYMSSGDNGLTFQTSHPDEVTAAIAKATFRAAKNVPWQNKSVVPLDPAEPASYTQGKYAVNYGKMKKIDGGSTDILNMDCCN